MDTEAAAVLVRSEAEQVGGADEGRHAEYTRENAPVRQYVGVLGIYMAAFALFLLVSKRLNRPVPDHIETRDIVLLGAATHKLGRIITKGWVTTPLRAPFAEFVESTGTGEVLERSRGRGWRRAFGDLLTCPYCMAPWLSALLTYGLVLSPRATRVVTSIFAGVAISDFLQQAYVAAKEATEEADHPRR